MASAASTVGEICKSLTGDLTSLERTYNTVLVDPIPQGFGEDNDNTELKQHYYLMYAHPQCKLKAQTVGRGGGRGGWLSCCLEHSLCVTRTYEAVDNCQIGC